jgi:hypothetical protein
MEAGASIALRMDGVSAGPLARRTFLLRSFVAIPLYSLKACTLI